MMLRKMMSSATSDKIEARGVRVGPKFCRLQMCPCTLHHQGMPPFQPFLSFRCFRWRRTGSELKDRAVIIVCRRRSRLVLCQILGARSSSSMTSAMSLIPAMFPQVSRAVVLTSMDALFSILKHLREIVRTHGQLYELVARNKENTA